MNRAPYEYRSDPTVPAFADDRPLLIFDGKCVLCSGAARFVLRNDRRGRFRFLAAQSPLGAALYRHFGLDPAAYETVILLHEGRAWFKSEAAIRTAAILGFPWSLAAAARIVPGRDALYDLIARHRLAWLGAHQTCYAPAPEERDRFIA